MTTITTPAIWYIAVALPTLIATVGAVYIINRATDYLQSRKLQRQQKDQSGSYSGMNWNAPRSWLAKITNTSFGESTAGNTASLDKTLSSSPGPLSQKRPEHSIQIFEGHSPGQRQPDASTYILDRQSPDQQQPKTPTGAVNRQSLDQQQSETSARILDGHPQDQQQPKSSTDVLDRQSPGQHQLEPSTDIPNEPSPGKQLFPTGLLDRLSPDQQQLEPSTDILSKPSPSQRLPLPGLADSLDVDNRHVNTEIPTRGSGYGHNSREKYGYRVNGVARVDSD